MTERQLQSIRKQLDKMDADFWNGKINRMALAREHFELDPSHETELAAEKAILDFEIAEIRYNGYTEILEYPEKVKVITSRVKAEVEEKQKTLRLLEGDK